MSTECCHVALIPGGARVPVTALAFWHAARWRSRFRRQRSHAGTPPGGARVSVASGRTLAHRQVALAFPSHAGTPPGGARVSVASGRTLARHQLTFFTDGPTTEAVATTLKPRKEKTKKPGGPTKQPKSRPSVAQPMKDLQAMQGEVFVFRVPARTFDDGAGGGTRQLSLSLLSRDRSPIPDDSWLTFNATSQTMSGLPLKALVRAPSVAKYHLVAENIDGRTASVKVTIEVVPRPSDEEFANHFAVAIDDDYDKFSRDPAKQRAFLGRLAAAFGDDDASQVALTSLTPGSTIVAWSNSSQSADECDEEAAKAVAGRMLDDDGNIREEFLEAMKPFVVAAASFAPGGDCVGKVEPLGVAPVPSGAAAASPDDDDTEEEEEVKEEEEVEKEEEDAVLLSTIIPVVVIAVLVVVAVLIACVLCRRRRRQKGYTKAATDDRDALRKHTPVILSGETDDAEMDRTAAASSPGATERQPRPPPEYHAMTDVPPPPPHGYRNGRGQQQQQQAYDQRYA
ncbi:PREDICTED: dystroglycan-like [Priapulus caudatus]|uniref:Dystroglycan-like n=1 Tax=Priapulus caudatus TaxID=37621 RepID=A0ABM1F2S2_PRICU|nr:PREDICTED: dystroglycan-like [Priapulus caudatus]